ncbi:lysosomal alpha-mannosidase [Ixodes scapularis]
MGGDLAYTKADSWFDNLDRLIAAVNKEAATTGTPVQAFYSTPSCYLRAVNNASAPWPVYTQDFLPYADKQHFYWTGLYSSRPSLKRYARYANGFLQACKQIAVTSGIRESILKFKQAVATMQHHDAVTGTSSEKVARDYAKMIGDSIFLCEKVISDGMVSSLWRNPESFDEPLQFCHRLNETVCFMTENVDRFVVVAYNPLSHKATHNIRLPVPFDDGYRVQSYDNKTIESQVVPRVNTVLELPSKTSTATNELVFQVEIPQLGASAFHVSRVPTGKEKTEDYSLFKMELEEVSIENEKYRLMVDATTGLLSDVVILERGETVSLRQSFFCYEAQHSRSARQGTGGPSGAFVFNPAFDEPYDLGTHATYRVVKGSVVQEIHQVFESWITQVIRLYKGQDLIEFEWMVGPIPIESRRSGLVGREIVSRFSTNLQNDGVFYTDSNGRTTIERRRPALPKMGSENWKPTSSSFFPVVSWIYIKDRLRNLQFTVLPDTPEGGTSLHDGQVELMVHRRLVEDDGCGLREPLNDTSTVIGRHLVHLGLPAWTSVRNGALRLVYAPVLAYAKAKDQALGATLAAGSFSGLYRELPRSVHLMTLEALSSTRALVRLEHLYSGVDSREENDVRVSVTNLLSNNLLEDVAETTLSAHMLLEEVSRLQWRQAQTAFVTGRDDLDNHSTFRNQDNYVVVLRNGQMRTFLATLAPRI